MKALGKFIAVWLVLSLGPCCAFADWQKVASLNVYNYKCVSSSNGCLYASTDEGLYRSTDKGISWVLTPIRLKVVEFDSIADTLFVVTLNVPSNTYAMLWSTDRGDSWQSIPTGFSTIGFLKAIGGILYATEGLAIYRSTNRGNTWQFLDNTMMNLNPSTNWHFRNVTDMTRLGSILLASTCPYGAYPQPPGGVYQSSDGGASWISSYSGITDWDTNLLCIVSDQSTVLTGGGFYTKAPSRIWRSTDVGSNWSLVYDGSGGVICDLICVQGMFIAVGLGNGVRLSNDSGLHWEDKTDGIFIYSIVGIAADDSYIYAAGSGAIWRRAISEFRASSIALDPLEVPQSHSLSQNYPNPFNPSTTIRYGLPNRSHVTLTVFNTLCQQVAALVNGDQEAGYHEVKFDASGLASGVYLYRMQAGSYVETRKLLLMK